MRLSPCLIGANAVATAEESRTFCSKAYAAMHWLTYGMTAILPDAIEIAVKHFESVHNQ